jgi:hypothetical protein
MVEATESAEGFSIAPFEEGRVFLKTEVKRELYEEAMVREVARRVQMMRKEKKLVESDRIALYLFCEDKEMSAIIKRHSGAIAGQVNAETVSLSRHAGAKGWEIGEAEVFLAMEKR